LFLSPVYPPFRYHPFRFSISAIEAKIPLGGLLMDVYDGHPLTNPSNIFENLIVQLLIFGTWEISGSSHTTRKLAEAGGLPQK